MVCAQVSLFESSRHKYKREKHIMLITLPLAAQQLSTVATALVSCRFHICFVLLFRCSKECAKPVSAHPLSSQSDRGQWN